MESRWLFTAFDWRTYHELSHRLANPVPAASLELAGFEGADEVLDDLGDDAAPEELRNGLLVELCCIGDGALFENGLPELVSWLRRQRRGDEPAEVLAEMISAAPGIQPWFATETGLVGLLTVDQTSELARVLGLFRRGYEPPARRRGIAALTRHFATSEPAIEHLDELTEIVTEAAAEMLGLAVIRVA